MGNCFGAAVRVFWKVIISDFKEVEEDVQLQGLAQLFMNYALQSDLL